MSATIPFASHKDCLMAIGLQSARDVVATTFYAIPTAPDDQEIDVNWEYSFFQFGGGFRGLTHYETKGEKIEGKLMIPATPGLVGIGDLYDWMWGREDDAYRQGHWATVVKILGDSAASNYTVEQYLNVKVLSGSIPVDFGMDFAKLSLNVQGISHPTTEAAPEMEMDLFETVPYRYPEVSVRLDPGTGSLAAEAYTRNHTLEWDNKVEPQEGLNGSTLAYDLPEAEWADWKVTFDRPFVDTTIREAFLAGTEVQYELNFTRSGGTLQFLMERLLYTKAPANPGTSGVVKQTGIAGQALCPLDDDTVMPCVISESVGS